MNTFACPFGVSKPFIYLSIFTIWYCIEDIFDYALIGAGPLVGIWDIFALISETNHDFAFALHLRGGGRQGAPFVSSICLFCIYFVLLYTCIRYCEILHNILSCSIIYILLVLIKKSVQAHWIERDISYCIIGRQFHAFVVLLSSKVRHLANKFELNCVCDFLALLSTDWARFRVYQVYKSISWVNIYIAKSYLSIENICDKNSVISVQAKGRALIHTNKSSDIKVTKVNKRRHYSVKPSQKVKDECVLRYQ